MNKTNELKKAVKEILRLYCPSTNFWRTITGKYPKLEFTLKYLDVGYVDKYILNINLYDKNTFERVEEIADTIDDEVGSATYQTNNFYIKFFNNHDRQPIDDADASIARLMMSYEINLYWRDNPNE